MKANPLLMDKSNPGKMTKGVILVINKGIMPLLKRVSRSLKTGKKTVKRSQDLIWTLHESIIYMET